MKIILLSGKPNSGKSTALNLLYDELVESKDCHIITPRKEAWLGECVLNYKGKTVAIKADGDVYQWCVDAIVKYAKYDILVLAYSDKFARSLVDIVSQYDYHSVVKKKCANDRDNEKVCREILEKL
jgi:tRNA uridine 5-carbamoylmethylation protein Kti12